MYWSVSGHVILDFAKLNQTIGFDMSHLLTLGNIMKLNLIMTKGSKIETLILECSRNEFLCLFLMRRNSCFYFLEIFVYVMVNLNEN